MKKKILLALSLVAVFCLGMIASAYTTHTNASATAMSCCCCSGDSCPMKKEGEKSAEHKDGQHKEGESGCCCKK